MENLAEYRRLGAPKGPKGWVGASSGFSTAARSDKRSRGVFRWLGALWLGAMVDRTCLAIVLAAGEGIRMRTTRPKVLHEVAGRSLLAHVLGVLREAGDISAAVVIGPAAGAVETEAAR